MLRPGERHGAHDRLYVPRLNHITGDIDIHDIAEDATGRVVFASALLSCLGTLSADFSLQPLWAPPFISRIAAEDRCHLNGLALRDGEPRYVTLVGPSDVADGWREHRGSGGVLMDVRDGTVLADGLSMPHSPRWSEHRLWLLDSGSGDLCWLDEAQGPLQRLTFCPGFARGLALQGGYAVVGVSRPRGDPSFGGLALDDALAARGATPRCALLVIDLASGDVVHSLWLEGGLVEEIYDIALLPGVVRPAAVRIDGDEILRTLNLPARLEML